MADQNTNETTQKKKGKKFLIAGLIVLGLGVVGAGVAFGALGNIFFLRELIDLTIVTGATAGLVTGAVKLIKSIANKNKNKSKTRTRTKKRTREQEQELEQEQKLENEVEKKVEKTSDLVSAEKWLAENKPSKERISASLQERLNEMVESGKIIPNTKEYRDVVTQAVYNHYQRAYKMAENRNTALNTTLDGFVKTKCDSVIENTTNKYNHFTGVKNEVETLFNDEKYKNLDDQEARQIKEYAVKSLKNLQKDVANPQINVDQFASNSNNQKENILIQIKGQGKTKHIGDLIKSVKELEKNNGDVSKQMMNMLGKISELQAQIDVLEERDETLAQSLKNVKAEVLGQIEGIIGDKVKRSVAASKPKLKADIINDLADKVVTEVINQVDAEKKITDEIVTKVVDKAKKKVLKDLTKSLNSDEQKEEVVKVIEAIADKVVSEIGISRKTNSAR